MLYRVMNGKHTVQRGDVVVRAITGQTIELEDSEVYNPDGSEKFPGRLQLVDTGADARALEHNRSVAEAKEQLRQEEQDRQEELEETQAERAQSARAQAAEEGTAAGTDEMSAQVNAEALANTGKIPGTGDLPVAGATPEAAPGGSTPPIAKAIATGTPLPPHARPVSGGTTASTRRSGATTGTGLVPPKGQNQPKSPAK